MKQRLQNKVAGSTLTLPISCVLTTVMWWLPWRGYSTELLVGWLLCVLTAYVLMELTAANVLLRIRSRMISSLYLLLMGACSFLHPVGIGNVLALLLVLVFFVLFRSYEERYSTTDAFHAAVCLSLGSLLWPPFLLLAPVVISCQGIFLRSLSWRMTGAWIIGLLVPYWFWLVIAYFMDNLALFTAHIAAIFTPFSEPFYWQWIVELAQTLDWQNFWPSFSESLRLHFIAHCLEACAFAYVLLLALTGFIHYVRKNYDDKIRVRMCYYCLMSIQVVLLLWLLVQPAYFRPLFSMLILTTVPSAAHFFALTHTWLTNAWFILSALFFLFLCFLSFFSPLTS